MTKRSYRRSNQTAASALRPPIGTAERSFRASDTTRAPGNFSFRRSPRKCPERSTGEAGRTVIFGASGGTPTHCAARSSTQYSRRSFAASYQLFPMAPGLARVEPAADRRMPRTGERSGVAVARLGISRAAVEEAAKTVAAEPRAKAVEVVGPHLVHGDHDDERGLFGRAKEAVAPSQRRQYEEKTRRLIRMRENKALPGTGKERSFVAAAGLAVAFAVSCGPETDPVQQTIDGIVEGAEDRQAAAIVERLSPDFQAADGSGRARRRTPTFAATCAAYESLGVRISELTIERAAGAARARFRADLSGSPRQIGGLEGLLPRASAYRFDLRLVPAEGGRWLVTWASWEPAS